jgi:D-alanine-D-alanine ligase-like ATP-grasp enzyme
MIYLFIFILFVGIVLYPVEGFNLRKKKYDSFFKQHNITNDKVNSTLTYQNKTVPYKYVNNIAINEKSIVKKLLIENNIPTAPFYMWNPVISDDDNLSHIKLKRPLVIKPDIGEKGLQVYTNIIDDADIINKVNKINSPVLIEEQIQGYKEYRITVINGAVIGATEKITASVTGDGQHTVLELIDTYNQSLKMYKIHTVDYDYIRQQGFQKHDVLPTGFHLILTNVANMSNGSQIQSIDIITIHPINILLFKNINHILKYTLSGIDYLGDLAVPYTLMGSVIEVNPDPGIDIHYTVVKHKRAFLTSIVDNLFKYKLDGISA